MSRLFFYFGAFALLCVEGEQVPKIACSETARTFP